MLIVDEASRVSEDLYKAVRPMLAVSKGRLVALSTPFGKMGWFYEEWNTTSVPGWRKFQITAYQCPRIDPAFLAEEKLKLGEKDIAAQIKKEFDKRHGATWHVVVGRNFGSYVTHGMPFL